MFGNEHVRALTVAGGHVLTSCPRTPEMVTAARRTYIRTSGGKTEMYIDTRKSINHIDSPTKHTTKVTP